MTQEQKIIRAKVGLLELAKQLGTVPGSSRPSLPRIARCNATFVKGLILFAVLAIMYAIGKRLGLLDEKPDSKDRDRPDCDPKNPSS